MGAGDSNGLGDVPLLAVLGCQRAILGVLGNSFGVSGVYEKHFSFPRINRLIAGACKGLIVRVMWRTTAEKCFCNRMVFSPL